MPGENFPYRCPPDGISASRTQMLINQQSLDNATDLGLFENYSLFHLPDGVHFTLINLSLLANGSKVNCTVWETSGQIHHYEELLLVRG